MKTPKPEPIVTSTVCSLCGLPWDNHGDKPTALTCIDLLRSELAKRPMNWFLTNAASNTSGTISYLQQRNGPPDDAVPAKVG